MICRFCLKRKEGVRATVLNCVCGATKRDISSAAVSSTGRAKRAGVHRPLVHTQLHQASRVVGKTLARLSPYELLPHHTTIILQFKGHLQRPNVHFP